MPKLNRRSVGTQSDVQVTEEEIMSTGKQFDVGGRHSNLCKKSAYRNLLQKSITVVVADADEVESGSCRATQTHNSGLWITEDRRTGPVRVGSSGVSVSIPGTSRPVVMQKDSASVQIDDTEKSWEVIFSRGERQSFASGISELPCICEAQRPPGRQSDEAVLLVQDYQSYDVTNATRRQDPTVPRRQPRRQSKRKKHGKKERPVPISPEASLTSVLACRICHEGEDVEPLIRPCLCKGSVGCIHAKCLKLWLEQSNNSRCEICGYPYAIRQTKKYGKLVSAAIFLRTIADRRALVYDIISFVAVTPLCFVGVAMCIRASLASSPSLASATSFQMGNVTRAGMIMLTTTILIAYSVWLYTLISYHYKTWKRWYNSCYDVEVIPVFMTSEERLEALHRLQEETRRRTCRTERRASAASLLHPGTVYHSLTDFYQRRFPVDGRVQGLPR